MLSTVWSLG